MIKYYYDATEDEFIVLLQVLNSNKPTTTQKNKNPQFWQSRPNKCIRIPASMF